MGRRSLQRQGTPEEARRAIARHFTRLATTGGINLAEFRAQLHEEEMVEILVGFAMDATIGAGLRRQCALDVVAIARGPLRPWLHDGETIDPAAEAPTGRSVGEEIDAARLSAAAYQALDDLVRRRVPPDQWPDFVRLAAGEALAFFEAESTADG